MAEENNGIELQDPSPSPTQSPKAQQTFPSSEQNEIHHEQPEISPTFSNSNKKADIIEESTSKSPSPSQTTQSVAPISATKPQFPLTIAMRDVDIAVKVPIENTPLPTIFTPFNTAFKTISGCIQNKPVTKSFYRLKSVSGFFKPGELTLVLSPPGHGRSSYLKAIQSSLTPTNGNIYYNGLSQPQCRKHDIDLTKLVQYAEQTDLHVAELTVNETIDFAMKMGSTRFSSENVTNLLEELGMIECRDVLVGDATLRGISGGQKRRLTTAVALASDANVMALDSLTDGLDSAVAEKIIRFLKNWCRTNQTQCVITLQQPTPQVYELFDHLVLLREGEVVYDGNKDDVIPFIEAMGYSISADVDICDFLMDVLSQPRLVLQNIKVNQIRQAKLDQLKREKAAKNAKRLKRNKDIQGDATPSASSPSISANQSIVKYNAHDDKSVEKTGSLKHLKNEHLKNGQISTSLGPIQPSSVPCITTEEMIEYFHTTPHWKSLNDNINSSIMIYNPDHVKNYKTDQALIPSVSQNPTPHGDDENEPHKQTTTSSSSKIDLPSSFTTPDFKKRYSTGYRQSIFPMLLYVLQRQWKLQWRSKSTYISRLINAVILGFLYAALYYDVALDNYRLRVAAVLLSFSQVVYNNMMDLAGITMIKPLIKQQMAQSMYPGFAWPVAYALLTIPYLLCEVSIFVLIFYFMESFTLNAGAFFTYFALLLVVSFIATFWYRFLAIIARDYPTASVLAAPTTAYFFIFSGFYITRSNLPKWLIWYYWISPTSWLVRAVSINEFRMSRYDELIPDAFNPLEMRRKGTLYLEYMDIYTDELWILWAVIYCLGFCAVMMFLSSLALKIRPPELSRGTRRVEDLGTDVEELHELLQTDERAIALKAMNDAIINNQQFYANEAHISTKHRTPRAEAFDSNQPTNESENGYENVQRPLATVATAPIGVDYNEMSVSRSITYRESSRSTTSHIATTQISEINKSSNQKNTLKTLTEKLPFSPTIVSFSNIRYTVQVVNAIDGTTSPKVLLDNVNGVCQNGFTTFLCGASGAGKTTLLDVLAGRKTTGSIDGTILFNGIAPTKAQQHSLMGFVEQFDSLFEYASVEETLQYAAELRLPPGTDKETRAAAVEEILQILDLAPLRHYIIGDQNTPGLSPAQRKLISIGLELVANPPVILYDEPTTGLDSRSAQTVMRAIKRVAQSGRTCILTIHQPSAELSYYADALSLLAPGGQQCFFGDVGFRFQHLVKYFKSIPGVVPLPFRFNVTTWLLEESSKVPDRFHISLDFIRNNTTILENSPKMRRNELKLSVAFSDIPDDNEDEDHDSENQDDFIDVTNYIAPMAEESWEALRPNQRWNLYLKWQYYAKCPQWFATQQKLKQIERIYFTTLGLADPVQGVKLVGGVGDDVDEADSPQIATTSQSDDKADNNTPQAANTSSQIDNVDQNNEAKGPLPNDMFGGGTIQPPQHPSLISQLGTFISRQTYLYYRNPHMTTNRTLVTVLTSLLAGLIYHNLQVIDASSVVSLLAATVMCSATIAINVASGSASLYFSARPLLYREADSGYYSTKFVWSFGVFVTEVFWAIPFAILGAVPIFFLIGLHRDGGPEVFFQFLLGIYTLMLILLSTQSFFTAVSRLPSLQQLLNTIAFGVYFALGGFAVTYTRLSQISGFHQFLYWIAPLGTLNFFYNCIFFGHTTTRTVQIIQNNVLVTLSLKDYAADFFGFNYELKWLYYCLLIIHILVIQVFYNVAMVFINHNKR